MITLLAIFLSSLLFPGMINKYSEDWRKRNVEYVKTIKTKWGSDAPVNFEGYNFMMAISYIIIALSFLACVYYIGTHFVNIYFS